MDVMDQSHFELLDRYVLSVLLLVRELFV